ncbi:MAG: glycoside hydrolase family 5 protein, partial [Armatimonadetes bacterium]|nr:glycoside hydrolase family 5 protein [Armatimonadota bacterium]
KLLRLQGTNLQKTNFQKSVRELTSALALLRELRQRLLNLRRPDARRVGLLPDRNWLIINDLNSGLENKFGWFDTTVLLDNDINRWGLRISTPATVLASPLSPAALVTVKGKEFTLEGWDNLKPLRVYQKPTDPTPVCLWVVINGKVVNLRPQPDGTVYDQTQHGRMSENWILLVCDMARGGGLPVQFVFLKAPTKVVFRRSDKGTTAVTVVFDKPDAQLFVLKPFKEWRGFLRMAQVLTRVPLSENEASTYIQQCRLWSRALLCYPVTFSEAFVRDQNDPETLIVANAYNYLELRDDWDTEPLKLAPLPLLASYGLLKGYPKLQVISDAKVLGSWGVWGDHIAVVGDDIIAYRVPIHPFKRFGGFTAFCFGPTDIGVLGNLTELELIKLTGANSFRPQHNRTDEAAMQLVRWCVERGLQHVFNVDEKWLPDVVEHYRTLAKLCKDLPDDAVAYDLLNEPETREPEAYNALLRRITQAIREFDKTHLIYAEVIAPWGPGAQPYPEAAFENLEPTGDPLTVYSFHDYEYRLMPRYPNEKVDIRTLLERWLPAFKFSIDHRAAIHLGEFGGFEQTKEDIYANRCTITMILDHFRIFDRFGWHFHYYSNRGIVRVRKDGSIEESLVQEAFRRYFGRERLNAIWE